MTTPLIHVSKPYLPDRARLARYIDRIYDTYWLTNRGPLVRELEERLAGYLGVERLILTSNGTLALQIAYRALGVTGSALTTPFSFVATAASLRWEGIEPVFVDIDPDTLNMDPSGIPAAVTAEATAIVPVHVYGNPSDPAIDRYASENDLRVVHDAAHAFGVSQAGRSVLARGDASILSLHATKFFHTAEGGAIVFTDDAAHTEALSIMNFGITGEDTVGSLGFNAKMSEMSAAMGLAVLDEIDVIMELRRVADERYLHRLGDAVKVPSPDGRHHPEPRLPPCGVRVCRGDRCREGCAA